MQNTRPGLQRGFKIEMPQNHTPDDANRALLEKLLQQPSANSIHHDPQTVCPIPDWMNSGDALYQRHLDPKEVRNFLDLALNDYAQALEQEPAQPSLLAKMARANLKLGLYDKAEQLAHKALKFDARQDNAWHVLGYIAYKNRQYAESIEYLKKAVRYNVFQGGKSRLCLYQAYQQRLAEQTGLSKLYTYLASLGQVILSSLFFVFEKDRLSFGDMLQMTPVLLKGYYFEESRQYDKALKVYLQLQEKLPGLPSLMNTIAAVYKKKNHVDEALFWYQNTIGRHPNNENAYFQIGQILEEKQDFAKAREVYLRLLALTPKDAHIQCSVGNTYYMDSQYDEALTYYKSALTLDGEPKWRSLIAQSIGNMQIECYSNMEAAQGAFQLAIDLNPTDVEPYIQLGLLHFKNKDFQNAKIVYEQAIGISPNNPRLFSNLGYLEWTEGRIHQAEVFYRKAIELDPFYEIPYNNLGVIYLDTLGKIPQAIELLEKAVSLNESYALAFYNLGRAYSFLDQKLYAANCFQTAQKLNSMTKELDAEELEARINHLFTSDGL